MCDNVEAIPARLLDGLLNDANKLIGDIKGFKQRKDIQRLHVHNLDRKNNWLVPRHGAFAASVGMPPSELLPITSAPHVDHATGMASVMTLTSDPKFQRTGTVLMRQKGTLISRINNNSMPVRVKNQSS